MRSPAPPLYLLPNVQTSGANLETNHQFQIHVPPVRSGLDMLVEQAHQQIEQPLQNSFWPVVQSSEPTLHDNQQAAYSYAHFTQEYSAAEPIASPPHYQEGEDFSAFELLPLHTENTAVPPAAPRDKVDPITGIVSAAPNAIPKSTFANRVKVDPITGQRSDSPNAVPRYTFYRKRDADTAKPAFNGNYTVDPTTGKKSTAKNAITRATFTGRQRVDPVTGHKSSAPNAIARSRFQTSVKVDPLTGQPSSEPSAIRLSTFKDRQKVDPVTGQPSNANNAIAYGAFRVRRWRQSKQS